MVITIGVMTIVGVVAVVKLKSVNVLALFNFQGGFDFLMIAVSMILVRILF
jgi:hypothetical protein